MEKENKILNYLTPELNKLKTYSVPVGYFDDLADLILFKVKPRKPTYSTPNNYFDDLSSKILSKVYLVDTNEELNELLEIAPILATLKRENVYKIPDGYFERLKSNNIATAKVVSIKRNIIAWKKYAAAAVIITLVGLGSVKFLSKPSSNTNIESIDIAASIEKMPENVLSAELLDDEKIFGNLVSEETANLPWQNIMDLQNELQFVPDNEMEFYLKENNISDEPYQLNNS